MPPRPDLTRKERLGQLVHHPLVSVAIVLLILLSVGMVMAQLLLPPLHPWQHPMELVQLLISVVFAVELGLKAYVSPSLGEFLYTYWLDLIAIIPWAHSLRVLRVLRLLRVFRAASILSRRIRVVALLVRSGVGEYVALGLILVVLVTSGTLALHHAERDGDHTHELAEPVNALWATVFFLVANEPMVGSPSTTTGKIVVLLTMFGGLTTFAVFTGVVAALMVNRLRRRMEIDDMDRYQLVKHLVICGWNNRVPLILEELLGGNTMAIVIVAEVTDLPPEVTKIDLTGRVFFVRGDFTRPEVLEQARLQHAAQAIIVADNARERTDQDRDARTVLAALMIERMNPRIHTCAELLNRQNEPHLLAAGVEEVVVISEAGGHHLALAALHTGLSKVVQELLTVKSGPALCKQRVPAELAGKDFGTALMQLKRDKNSIAIGIEVRGQEGPKALGYRLLVNPALDTPLSDQDNLIVVSEPCKEPRP